VAEVSARGIAPRKAESKAPRLETMSGLAKGLAIIEAFAAKPALTIADAAKASGATRAAARRCLLTLAEGGYVEFNGKLFRPLPRLLGLGGGTSRALTLPQAAQPFLERTRDALEESVSLAVLDGEGSLFIARAEAGRIVSTGVRIGARLPAFLSCSGRVLLAALPHDEMRTRLARADLPRRTPKTLVEPKAVARAICDAQKLGYALGDEEVEIGLRAIACRPHARGDERQRVLGARQHRANARYILADHAPQCRGARQNPVNRSSGIVTLGLEHFQAKWMPVRVKKIRQNKNIAPRSDSIGTDTPASVYRYRAPNRRNRKPLIAGRKRNESR
jgi:IclR family pca regulon transcriptional regulator